MQPQTTAPADPLVSPSPRRNALRMTSRQLSVLTRGWERVVIVPKPDEEAWEGTEIDVRRTVL